MDHASPVVAGEYARVAPSVRFVPSEGFIDADRLDLIARPEAQMTGHIALDRIQMRPGWLLFDPAQVLGEPAVVLRFDGATPAGEALEVQLFPLEHIRRLETLLLLVVGRGIARANADRPVDLQLCTCSLHGARNVFGQRTKRCDPDYGYRGTGNGYRIPAI